VCVSRKGGTTWMPKLSRGGIIDTAGDTVFGGSFASSYSGMLQGMPSVRGNV